jgi:hypothetical protein
MRSFDCLDPLWDVWFSAGCHILWNVRGFVSHFRYESNCGLDRIINVCLYSAIYLYYHMVSVLVRSWCVHVVTVAQSASPQWANGGLTVQGGGRRGGGW